MSSDETASATDAGPVTQTSSAPNLRPIRTKADNRGSSASRRPYGDSAITSPISPISPGIPRKPVKQRAVSQNVLTTAQTNGNNRTYRSASTNPREIGKSASLNSRSDATSPSASSRLHSTPSLQEIIKRFNDQPDEALPLPRTRDKSVSRPGSRAASPALGKHVSTTSTAKKPPPPWKSSGPIKTPGTATRQVATITKIPLSTRNNRDRHNSVSSTSSQQSRGRRPNSRTTSDNTLTTLANKSRPPSSSRSFIAPSEDSDTASINLSVDAEVSRQDSESPQPLSPVSPTDSISMPCRLTKTSGRPPPVSTPGCKTDRSGSAQPLSKVSDPKKGKIVDSRTSGRQSPVPNAHAKPSVPSTLRKSPPLRSSRPRIPVTAVKSDPAKSIPTKLSASSHARVNGKTIRKPMPDEDEARPKKKIPELGSVDFAARRKMIATAFNDRMDKEREERNRAWKKKEQEREAAAAKLALEQSKVEDDVLNDDTVEITADTAIKASPDEEPIGLGLDFGQEAEEENNDEKAKNAELVDDNAESNGELDEVAPSIVQIRNDNSAQLSLQGSPRPLSVIEASPRSPKVPGKPEEYKRWSSSLKSYNNRSISINLTVANEDPQSPLQDPESPVSPRPLASPIIPPKLLIPQSPRRENLIREKTRSASASEPTTRAKNDWEKAVEEEKFRRLQIEQDREMKLKNRLSTPVSPKVSSPQFDSDATPTGKTAKHKKQSSWSASPHLAPPDSLGNIMWQFRPLSTGGESMIDSFYKEQDELFRARKRKQELMRFEDNEDNEDIEESFDNKGQNLHRYTLTDNAYPLEAEQDDEASGGYVNIEGTYRYSASTVNSSTRSRSLDPNDYWTPQPSTGDFEVNQPRESWATDSTMTSYSTSSGLAAHNGTGRKPITNNEQHTSETPPTPPPKDSVFASKYATSTSLRESNAMQLPLPSSGLSARRASISTDSVIVEPLKITKPLILQREIYNSPISIRSAISIPSTQNDGAADAMDASASSSEYSDDDVSNHSGHTPESAPLYLGASPSTSVITTSGSFVSSIQDVQAQEKKMLIKRRYLLKELLDTEKSYFQDMTVTEEIYKGTADACDDLKTDDVRVMFGNMHSIVAFSREFLETLKAAIAPVYVLVKAGKTPMSSQVSFSEHDVQASAVLPEVDAENDQKTWVGEAFVQVLPNMEKVYGDYCKNHETAVGRLQSLEKLRGVSIWLKECKHVADDLTNAWSLESLLIKPVQRLLKYPLLLDQILECTPERHPDREALEIVAKEVKFVTERINESKKRKDLMDKLVGPRKRADTDLRHGLTKGFQRRAEKLRQSVGLSEMPQDERYKTVTTRFREQYFKLQLVQKDIEMYVNDVDKQIYEFGVLAVKFEEFASCSPTRFKEYEDRWQNFTKRMKEMKEVVLVDHRIRIKRHVITPLETALKLCENPQKVMLKREKKAVDFARYRAIMEKGDKPDKKTKELAEAYMAVNETLLDELPKLHELVESLVAGVVCNFAELCGVWEKQWEVRLEGLLDPLDIPSNFSDIIEVYKSDFGKVEPVVESMTITNSNSRLWKAYSLHSQSSSSHLDTGSTSSLSLHRTSTGDTTASPNPSTFSRTSMAGTPKRLSGTFAQSPLIAAIGPALPMLPGQLLQQQSQAHRGRATSAILTPAPSRAAPPPPIRAYSSANIPGGSPNISPTLSFSSASGQNGVNRPPSYPRLPSIHGLDSGSPSQTRPSTSSENTGRTVLGYPVLWLCASIYSYQASKEADSKRDDGFCYLTYDQGEVFDVIGTKGEYWLAKNQDDESHEFGWIWSKHFAKLAVD